MCYICEVPMSKIMIEVNDVTMRFRMNSDKIMSLKEIGRAHV